MNSEDDQDQPTINDDDIPEEEASQQEIIPFMGDELAAALTPGGIVYISLPGICRALGLTVQPQLLRIKRTRSLTFLRILGSYATSLINDMVC